MFKKKKTSPFDQAWVHVLGTYNSEVGRGIVHTDEWRALMKDNQELFDSMKRDEHENR